MAKKSQTTDQTTLDLIEKINDLKAEIAAAQKPNWKTNRTFSYFECGSPNVINLAVETDIRVLVSIAAFLVEKEASYCRVALRFNIEAPPFMWLGFSVEDWVDDIKTRIAKIQISSRQKKFEMLEERLNKIISPELRAKMELEAISKELSK